MDKTREESILEINRRSIGKKARVLDGITGLIIDASVEAFLIENGLEKIWISLYEVIEIS